MQQTPSSSRFGLPQSTPRTSSRPRPTAPPVPKLPSSLLRSPPLGTSQYDNLASTPHALLPKDGSIKLKIKSTTTPEARSRVLIKPTPGPGRSMLGRPGMMNRAITPSDSEGSLMELVMPTYTGTTLVEEGEVEGEQEAVLVTVRVRPPNPTEVRNGAETVWNMPEYDHHLLKLDNREAGRDDREWIFDRILPPDADNAKAYATSARAHVRSAMEGFNALIFAYGQTASGKTHTLTGSPSAPGIIPLSITDLFSQIRRTPDREFLLRASYLELYNEAILDLLSPEVGRELQLSEGKKKGEVVVNGLTECAVRAEEDVRRLLSLGEERRKVGGTDWNSRSSRSHCVFRIVIESRAARSNVAEDITSRTPGGRLKAAGEKMTRISTLSIIDLAGSEKHTSSKERNAEGKHINQSLLTLKLVISKLADMASKRNVTHVPYRDSKLTRLLQPSLSGDALISVICTISPSALNVAESLSTISFAQGLKRVVLKAQKKEVVDPQALIQQYQNEIAELKALLRMKDEGRGGAGGVTGNPVKVGKDERQKNDAMEMRLNELKSLILTSGNVSRNDEAGSAEARPLSPTKLKYPKLDFDRSTAELQEELHAAELKITQQSDEIDKLQSDLESRPLKPNTRILKLQEEVSGLKMIAADYERHLREPTQKVRADVEREWSGKLASLERQLESKRIWADRLDENVRAVTAENKSLEARCGEAEAKVLQIMEWVNTALLSDESDSSPTMNPSLPTLTISQDYASSGDDFNPSSSGNTKSTITLTSKMTRAALSHMDLARFNDKFGSVKLGGGRGMGMGGGRMLREESGFDLAGVMGEEDDTF